MALLASSVTWVQVPGPATSPGLRWEGGSSYLRDCFHFFFLGIWACAVEHLEEVRCFCSHSCMNIGLRVNTGGAETGSRPGETALLSLGHTAGTEGRWDGQTAIPETDSLYYRQDEGKGERHLLLWGTTWCVEHARPLLYHWLHQEMIS